MEIYKDLSSPASQEFEKLLNSQLSKVSIEEGKIIDGKINKITEKFVFLFVEGLKSEPVLDINELKSMGLADKIKVGETISVLLEKIEDKNGEVLVRLRTFVIGPIIALVAVVTGIEGAAQLLSSDDFKVAAAVEYRPASIHIPDGERARTEGIDILIDTARYRCFVGIGDRLAGRRQCRTCRGIFKT